MSGRRLGCGSVCTRCCWRVCVRRVRSSGRARLLTEPRAGEKGGSATGPSPVDRARNGSKHHLLVDGTGIPLAWTLTGGHRHDRTQLIPLVDRVPPVRGKVGRPRRRPDRVCADRGYDYEESPPRAPPARHHPGDRPSQDRTRLRPRPLPLGRRKNLRLAPPVQTPTRPLRPPSRHPRGLPRDRLLHRLLPPTPEHLIVKGALKPEEERQGLVDRAELADVESPGRSAEELWIDDGRLLDEDARLVPVDGDLRPEAGGVSARRGWRDENGAEVEELVCLDDNGVPSASLLVPPRASGRREPEELAANHLAALLRSEPGELLTDDAHLLAIVLVGGESTNFVTDRRAQPATYSGLAERRANGLGVGQAVAANDLQRRRRGVVEPDVKRPSHTPNVAQIMLRGRCGCESAGDVLDH